MIQVIEDWCQRVGEISGKGKEVKLRFAESEEPDRGESWANYPGPQLLPIQFDQFIAFAGLRFEPGQIEDSDPAAHIADQFFLLE